MRLKKTISIGIPCTAAFVFVSLMLTHPPASAVSGPVISNTAFPNPTPVTIRGYAGSAEVPYLTPDGNYLVFDNRTDPAKPDIKIYYAQKIDDADFQFIGEVRNTNLPGTINFQSSIDRHNNFYFTRIPLDGAPARPTGKPSIYHGVWDHGTLLDVAPVGGIDQDTDTINQDPAISYDGQVLIFNAWDFARNCLSYKIASKVPDGSFTVLDDSDVRLTHHLAVFSETELGNYLYRCTTLPHPHMTHSMLMGPVMRSHSGLKVVFTMIHPGQSGMPVETYYLATRGSLSEPFGKPRPIIANGRVVEGGSFSPDDRLLYFHLSKGDGTFSPYVMPIDSN